MMAPEVVPAGALNVRTFGAVGNGQVKDTAAFQKALDAARDASGGVVWVPAGSYLIGSITVSSNTTLQFSRAAMLTGSPDIADYPLGTVRYEGEYVSGHRALISATNASNVTLTGPGWIFGPPASLSRLRSPRGPVLLEFTACANVTLDGFTAQYQMLWTIHPLLCTNFTARNLIIRSVGSNSDGIDVDSCSGVLIDHCNIDTGDDAIALKSGRGQAAVTLARPTENVEITHCSLLSSIFGALAIGSEISGGIRHIHVADCVLSGHQNSIFIKSRDGRAGFIDDINGENLTVYNSPTFVCFNLAATGIQATDPVPGDVAQWTRATNIRFSNVELINVTDAVLVRPLKGLDGIPAAVPTDGFSLTNIHGTATHGFTLTNMANVTISNLTLTGYTPPLFTLKNVQGTGLEEAK
jgi:polygalacturonase